ncbi:MAG: hypothetical protein P8O79_08145 [Halieaceae bacterium]|nr:hypothetical protein [Halieaceae bacterium]
MLGPEQINLPIKLNPMVATEATPLRVNHEAGRALGLLNHQIIKGLVETRGDALGLRLKGEFLELPKAWQGQVGQTLAFKAIATSLGFNLIPQAQVAAGQGLSSELLRLFFKPATTAQSFTRLLTQLPQLAQQLPALALALAPLNLRSGALNAQSLATALLASGLFGESKIKRGLADGDLKVTLRQLLLNEVDANVRALLGDGIDELEHRQLEAVQAQQRGDTLLHFSFLLDSRPTELQISHSPHNATDEQIAPWVVDLKTELGAQGTVWLNARFYLPSALEIIAWIPNKALAVAAQAQVGILEQNIAGFNLDLQRAQIIETERPERAQQHPQPGQVLDVST